MLSNEFLDRVEMAHVQVALDESDPVKRRYATTIRDRMQDVLNAIREEKDLPAEVDGHIKAVAFVLAVGSVPIPNAIETITKKLFYEMDQWYRVLRRER